MTETMKLEMTQFDTWCKLLALAQANPTTKALRAVMAAANMSFDNDTPISGYFRCAEFKGGPLEPLTIFRDESGELNVWWGFTEDQNGTRAVNKQRGDEIRINKFWPYAAWKPVPWEWWAAKIAGKEWPDVHSLVPDEPLDGIEELAGRIDEATLAGMGHNSGEIDEALFLRGKIDEALRGVKQYATVNEESVAASQELRSRLLAYSGEALKNRTVLSRPHLDAIETIRSKWTPLVDSAKDGADKINAAQTAFATAQARRKKEEEQRIEAERKRLEQEAADRAAEAQAAVDAGQPPPDPIPQARVEEPARVAPQTTIKGGTGRAAHVSKVTVITEVTDWAKLYLYFVNDQVVRDYILKRAQMFLKSTGEIPPGCVTDVAAKVA